MDLRSRISPLKLKRIASVIVATGIAVAVLVAFFVMGQSRIAFAAAGDIRGYVYRDFNDDGLRDADEVGIEGVIVTAYPDSGTPVSTTTDVSGMYTLTHSFAGNRARVEFSLPNTLTFLQPAAAGGTSVQFVDISGGDVDNVNANFNNPAQYCDLNPLLATTCFSGGDPLLNGPASNETALVNFNYHVFNTSAISPTGNPEQSPTSAANMGDLGAVWGAAYDPINERMFTSAFLKRHTGLGTLGLGGIYVTTYTNRIPGDSGEYVDLVTMNTSMGASNPITVGAVYSVPGATAMDAGTGDRTLPGNDSPSFDLDAYNKVGKVGLGDLEISDDYQTLYSASLYDRTVYQIDISDYENPSISDSFDMSGYDTAYCNSGYTFRPWALKYHDGTLYAGGVCVIESLLTAAADGRSVITDMEMLVTQVDLAANTSTFVYSRTLDYGSDSHQGRRDNASGAAAATWNNWSPYNEWTNHPFIASTSQNIVYPEPILSNIEIDTDGSLILALMDRHGHMVGAGNYSIDQSLVDGGGNPREFTYTIGGDVVRACKIGGVFIDSGSAECENANLPYITNFGQRESQFYVGFAYPDGNHYAIGMGGLSLLAGSGEVAAVGLDPFDVNSGGIFWASNSTGLTRTKYQLYDQTAGLGKANGLGDMELICTAAPIEIGNRVWFDSDGDGIQDPSEKPIGGVEVALTDASGNEYFTTTDSNGQYYFNASNVAVGIAFNSDYTVTINMDQPELRDTALTVANATASTTVSDGVDSDAVQDGNLAVIALTTGSAGANNHTHDFGFTDGGSIGNYVWVDEDSNGYQDEGERGIPNVEVQLKDSTGTVILTTTTDTHGGYLFTGLPAGDYFVDIVDSTIPDGMSQTTLYTNEIDGADADGVSDDGDFGNKNHSSGDGYAITLDFGEENLTADFGYNYNPTNDVNNNDGTAALGDFVWIDADGDGAQDPNEIGVSGVTVSLLTAGPDGLLNTADDVVSETTTTDVTGYYIFDGLEPGAYVVEVTDSGGASHDVLGAGYDQTGDPDHFGISEAANPGTAGEDDNKTTTPVILGPGDVFLNADFGYQPGSAVLNSVGDTVFLDADADGNGPSQSAIDDAVDVTQGGGGTADADDYGIAGVSVILIQDTNGNGLRDGGEPIIATDLTDSNGQYLFEGLADGSYIVAVDDTDNTLYGLNQSYDEDGILGTPDQSAVDLDSAGSDSSPVDNRTQDFGYSPSEPFGVIGDTVWYDVDGTPNDEDSRGADPGISGVTVVLYQDEDGDNAPDDLNGDGVVNELDAIDTQVTDVNGQYLFTELPFGDYFVSVVTSTLHIRYNRTSVYDAGSVTNDSTGDRVTLSTTTPYDFDQDFSYTLNDTTLASIGDQVWGDIDSSGGSAPNAGDVLLAGVTVRLFDNDGNSIDVTTTNNEGYYLFTGLSADDYHVIIDTTTIPAGFDITPTYDPDGGADNTSFEALSAGEHDRDQDFSYPPNNTSFTIGDRVWFDVDGAGGADTGTEPGLPGVTVLLYNSSGVQIDSTVTDENGNYLFTGLTSDNYTVIVDTKSLPVYVQTTSTYAGTDGIDTDSSATNRPVNSTSGNQHRRGEDFSYPPVEDALGAIGDTIFIDVSAGVGGETFDPANDIPLEGVTVTLENPDGTTEIAVTDENGRYYFGDLDPSATYTVTVDTSTLPGGAANWSNTADPDGDDNSTSSSTLTPADPIDLTRDFGYVLDGGATAGSIGNVVWEDSDADGVKDASETTGFAGVTIDLYYDADGNGTVDPGEPRIGTTTTDGSGTYLFSNLPTDDGVNGDMAYVVDVSDVDGVLNGYWHSIGSQNPVDPAAGDTVEDTNDNSKIDVFSVVLTSTTIVNNLNVDFGYYKNPAAVGNYVWIDSDADGIQDSSERGVDGIRVTLSITYPNGTVIQVNTVTGDDPSTATVEQGWYEFTNLLLDEDYSAGSGSQTASADTPAYSLSVDTTGYSLTLTDVSVGATDQTDSDAQGVPATPTQGVLDTTQNGDPTAESDPAASYDFGLVELKAASVGNYVWFDENSDGFQDEGEPGIPNVVVQLKDSTGTVVMTTTTDSQGGYLFSNLTPDEYFIDILDSSIPSGMTQTDDYTNNVDGSDADTLTDDGDFGNKDHDTGNGYAVTLDSGEENLTADFGYNYNPTDDVNGGQNTAALGDRVWIDTDGDGFQDPNEVAVSGAIVTLIQPGADGLFGTADDDTSTTTTTDSNGYYIFDGLTPGAYQVEVTDSSGANHDVLGATYSQTGDPDHFGISEAANPGTYGEDDNKTTDEIILGPGDVFLNADFGYQPTTAAGTLNSVGDTVYFDVDMDGSGPSLSAIDDGSAVTQGDNTGSADAADYGIAGVTVVLIEDNNDDGVFNSGDNVIATDTTDENGQYLFESLPDGNYIVWVNDTDNILHFLTQSYDDDGVAGTPNTSAVNLDSSNASPTSIDNRVQDFGYGPSPALGTIGDLVWFDVNNSQDNESNRGAEPGIPNVTVLLYQDNDGGGVPDDINGDGSITSADAIQTTTTDPDGRYLFTNLPYDTYIVEVDTSTLDAKYNTTSTYDPPGSAVDSRSGSVTVNSGTPINLDQDFSYTLTDTTLSSIGDQIWGDLLSNGDGTFDDGDDVPFAGVTVRLTDSSGNVTTTETDSNGFYLFTDLPGGGATYTITVDTTTLPPGFSTTSSYDPFGPADSQSVQPLGDNSHNRTQDFSYPPSGTLYSIGDYVWFDVNNSGQDEANSAGELGLANVTVNIYDSGGSLVGQTTTDDTGKYLFTGLAADDYTIVVDTSTLPGYVSTASSYDGTDNSGTPSNDSSSVVTVGAGVDAHKRGEDFSYPPVPSRGAIGDTIFVDADGGSGGGDAYDPAGGDTPLEGVTVTLEKPDGSTEIRVTDENGRYYFGDLDPNGAYTVTVDTSTLPGGASNWTNTADPNSDDNSTSTVTLTATNPINLDQDFGYDMTAIAAETGSIGNLVWEDTDSDGVKDASESGIAGVTIDLYYDANGDGIVNPGEPKIGTTTTDATGGYLFEDLPVDNGGSSVAYIVDVTDEAGVLAGYWHSLGDQSAAVDDNSKADPFGVVLSTGTPDNLNVDFGYYVDPAALGNFVWLDDNKDGLQDTDEIGLDGITLTLNILYPDSTTVSVSTVTGDDPSTDAIEKGWYSFPNLLLDEDYRIGSGLTTTDTNEPAYTITIDTGEYTLTLTDAGDDQLDSDASGVPALPVQGATDTTQNSNATAESNPAASYDFGMVEEEKATIGNYVWLDEDSNGYQDEGERGIPGVEVQLKDSNGTVVMTTTTDFNGGYLFTGITPGDYFVDILDSSIPTGMTQTSFYTNVDDGPDADIVDDDGDFGNKNHSGTGYAVTLDPGEENLTADFGYNYNPTVDVTDGMNTAVIGDRVWIDSDGDGVQDPGEAGVAGISVTLRGPGPDGLFGTGDDTALVNITDANGYYIFDGLTAGAYKVEVTDDAGSSHDILNPTNYSQTGDPDHFAEAETGGHGEDDHITTDAIVLAPGDVFLNADFGYQPTASVVLNSVGDTVWYDNDMDGNGPSLAPVDGGSAVTQGAGNGADTADTGIPGVTVALILDANNNGIFDESESIIATTVTDSDGQYLFSDLPDGYYLVWVNDTDNVLNGLTQSYDSNGVLASPNMSASDLDGAGSDGSSVDDRVQDFGYGASQPLGEIGDLIWFDVDDSQDDETNRNGEPGIPGVTVSLYQDNDGDGTPDDVNGDGVVDENDAVKTTTTDGNGRYTFTDLPLDSYIVKVVTSTLPAKYNTTSTFDPPGSTVDSTSDTITLTESDPNDKTADFSYTLTDTTLGSIGDFIWGDEDNNGASTPNGDDVPLGGVTVRLTDSSGNVQTTVTDNQGYYLFPELPADTYTVTVDTTTLPSGWLTTSSYDPPGSTTDSENVVTLVAGVDDRDQDFSYPIDTPSALFSIGDRVWLDEDGLGGSTQDAGEPGLPGVKVELVDNGGTVVQTVTTDENGDYIFTDVTAGTYTVRVVTSTLPSNVSTSSTYDGSDGTNNDAQSTLTVNGSNPHPRVEDFSFPLLESRGGIGDTIFIDDDSSGSTFDPSNDTPIEGVTVVLTYPSGVTVTTTTDENGKYYFGDLDPNGTYTVTVDTSTLPGGAGNWSNTADPEDDNNSTSIVTLTPSNPVDLIQDFGYEPSGSTGSIGNLVWEDTNADGQKDATESGIDGVTLDLYYDTNGNGVVDPGEPLIGSTVTAGGGSYDFIDLPYGDYVVDVTDEAGLLNGYWHSTGNQDGTDSSGNSNPDESKIDTFGVTIDSGTPINNNVDFGYYKEPASLGNLVWYDSDGDGIQDGGELGIDGITVTLTIDYPDAGATIVLKTVTGDDPSTSGTTETGWYSFPNLLFDENLRTGSGVAISIGNSPAYVITVDTGDYILTFNDEGSDDQLDSDLSGVAATPTQGFENVAQNVDPTAEGDPIASYDFGVVLADLGDLPDTGNASGAGNYQTQLSDDGAAHIIVDANNDGVPDAGQIYLGATVDSEADGQQSSGATGDGADEDGVVVNLTDWENGTNGGQIGVTVGGGGGYLVGWIDFDGDGTFDELVTHTFASAGSTNIDIDVPASFFEANGTVGGSNREVYARFRLFESEAAANAVATGGTIALGDGFAGRAVNGEVEDYVWNFTPTAVTMGDSAATSAAYPPQHVKTTLYTIFTLLVMATGSLWFARRRELI